ncbi:MAG: class I SAM-dependent methyltransferase [Methanomassiliicoccales archaeon]|nr:class I SAM-dependent methyltransferase [Methanomassiliicoccales archaeon]
MTGTMSRRAEEVFGERAVYYAESTAHSDQDELRRIVELVRPDGSERMLDVATGPGHIAFAFSPFVHQVVGIDLTPQMLDLASKIAKERGIGNAQFVRADVANLPFPDQSFDLVTCRRAAHHFLDPEGALREMRRVLRAGGKMLIEDRSVPEDSYVDETLNHLDVLHDPSHVREYRLGEWRAMLDSSGLRTVSESFLTKHRPIGSLTDTAGPDEAREILRIIYAMSDQERKRMNIEIVEGRITIDHYLVMILALRD